MNRTESSKPPDLTRACHHDCNRPQSRAGRFDRKAGAQSLRDESRRVRRPNESKVEKSEENPTLRPRSLARSLHQPSSLYPSIFSSHRLPLSTFRSPAPFLVHSLPCSLTTTLPASLPPTFYLPPSLRPSMSSSLHTSIPAYGTSSLYPFFPPTTYAREKRHSFRFSKPTSFSYRMSATNCLRMTAFPS